MTVKEKLAKIKAIATYCLDSSAMLGQDELKAEFEKIRMIANDQPVSLDELRDRLAAKVIQGLLANPSGPIQANGMCGWSWCNCTVEQVADLAWYIADHMIKARGGSNAD